MVLLRADGTSAHRDNLGTPRQIIEVGALLGDFDVGRFYIDASERVFVDGNLADVTTAFDDVRFGNLKTGAGALYDLSLNLGLIVDGAGAAAGIIVYDAEGTASDFTVAGSPRASTDQYLSARHLLLLERADGFVLVETDLTDDEDGIAGITPLTIPAAIAAKDPLFFSLFVGEGNFFRLIA